MTLCRTLGGLIVVVLLVVGALNFVARAAVDQRAKKRVPYEISGGTQPRLFAPGIISTRDYESNSTFTPDGKTIYFTKRNVGYNSYLWVICRSTFANGRWATPEVAEFSGEYRDSDPFISSDGARLFFVSDRPTDKRPRGDFDVWVMDKRGTGWSEPRNLRAPINTSAGELYPTTTADGTLYFASDRHGGKGRLDIYRARLVNGSYAEPENVGESINTPYSDTQPFVAPDESFLLFSSSGRPDETMAKNFHYPRGDLYMSYRKDGVWMPARNLGPQVNTPASESRPSVSPDGKYLFFTSEKGFATPPRKKRLMYGELVEGIASLENGLGNIYQIRLNALERKD